MKLEEIDRNFMPETVRYEGMKTVRIPDPAFELRGFGNAEIERFRRVPEDVAAKCTLSLQEMCKCPSGGRIRFRTDSSRFIIGAKQPDMMPKVHQSFTGSSCFDLYVDGRFVNAFRPDVSGTGAPKSRHKFFLSDGYDALLTVPGRKMRDVLIHFPLYAEVKELYLSLEADAVIEAPKPYATELPIVYYGSSITQGGCASHAGNAYPAILARMLDADFINLGFSSGGKGELEMAEYIAGLPMSALVMDYDHNAPNAAHLRATYEPFFRHIRNARPDLPVIMISAADAHWGDTTAERREVIHTAYRNALKRGDQKVWFIDGQQVFEEFGGASVCTVDMTHPNDLGFWAYAKILEPVLREALGK